MVPLPTLDTMRVVAMDVSAPNLARDLIGFERRRLGGIGAFMTHEEIKGKFAVRFGDLFRLRAVAWVGQRGGSPVRLRNWFGSRRDGAGFGGFCSPNVCLDGFPVRTEGFLNGFRTVDDVVADEIYERPWTVPAKLAAPALSVCGSLGLWTTQRVPPENKP